MNFIWDKLTEWIRELLIEGIMNNLTGLFDQVNTQMENSPDAQGEVFDFFLSGVSAGQAGNYDQAYATFYDDAFFFEDPLLRGIGSLGDLLRTTLLTRPACSNHKIASSYSRARAPGRTS